MKENNNNNNSLAPMIASTIMVGSCCIPFMSTNFDLMSIGSTFTSIGVSTLSCVISYFATKSIINKNNFDCEDNEVSMKVEEIHSKEKKLHFKPRKSLSLRTSLTKDETSNKEEK